MFFVNTTPAPGRPRFAERAVRAAGAALALLASGCPSLETLPTQAPIQEMTDEGSGQSYLLYVPSTYSENRDWPLVIVCHGTWPYDSAELQMREWAGFAQNNGIIVAAPKLAATKGDFPPPPDEQIALQRQDEGTILGVVDTLRRRYRIAEEQIFMTGWSAGGYSILHTGLRHPEIFRALVVRQGSFDERFMDVPVNRMDRWQGIKIVYGKTDVLRDQTKASVKWLRDQGLYVDEEEISGTHRRIDPSLAWKFFRSVAKERLWIQIETTVPNPDEPLTIRFDLTAEPPVVKQKWFFGDDQESFERSPTHTYAQPGQYEVTVNTSLKSGKKYSRKRTINVGRFPGG
jgi:predicted esterase